MRKRHVKNFFLFLVVALTLNLFSAAVFAEAVVNEDQEVFSDMQASATIIETTSGTLLMIGQDKLAVDTPTKILSSFSTDGGYTWSTPTDLDLTRINNAYYRMPNLVKLSSGRILLILHRRVTNAGGVPAVCYSDNNGISWSTPTRIRNETETSTYLMNDRIRVLSDGRIVIPVARGFGSEGTNSKIGSYYSDDNGVTWSVSDFVTYTTQDFRGAQEPAIVQLTNGNVMMIMRTGLGYLYKSISTDGGESWPIPTAMSLESPCSPVNVRRAPDGKILIAWNNAEPSSAGSLGPRYPLTCAVSSDEGQTWSNYLNIEDSNYDCAYPSIWFTDDDVIFTYYTRQSGYPDFSLKKTIVSQSAALDGIIPEPSTEILDEEWDSMGTWAVGGTTVEISPAGQLHLEDNQNTTTNATQSNIAVPQQYELETKVKVDDYTTTASTSLGTKVIDGTYRLMVVLKSDGIYMIDSSDSLVRKKSITMDSSWHTYNVVVDSGQADVYMDGTFQFSSSMQTNAGSDIVEQWTQSADSDNAEAHIDYTKITNCMVDEQWDALTDWSTSGSTVEISPAGQLHLTDSSNTVTKAYRSDIVVPTAYTVDTYAKVDDYTTTASTSFGTKILDGSYRLMLVIKSDGIYMIDSSDSLVKKKSITMDTDWHLYRAVVDDGEAQVYMDGEYQFTSSMQTLSGSNFIEQWTHSASQDTCEVHVDYTLIKYGNPPGNFSLSSPASGTNRTTVSPQFSWSASSGADAYQIVIADNDQFSDPVIVVNNCTGTSYTASNLASNTTYYWKVIAKNAVGNTSATNNYFTFATGILDEPWNSLTGWSTTGRTVEISPSGQLHLSDSSNTITEAYRSDIAIPATYTLETKAKVDDYTTTDSTSFGTKIMDGTYRLMLVLKSDGIYMIDSSGSLVKKKSITMDTDWHTYRAVVYDGEAEVYMDDEYQFTSSMQTLSGSDQIEHWTQSASLDTSEVYIDYSVIKYDNPPQSFALISPADGDTEVGTTTVLAWETSNGVNNYRVVVADNASFTNPICDAENSNVPSFVLSGLSRNTTYYWKVIAENSVGDTLVSNSPYSFTTGILDEQWSNLDDWSTSGSTAEISPAGQLHLLDSSDTATAAYTGIALPTTYTIETYVKVDDYTTTGSTSFGVKVMDGTYRLMLVLKSDGIYLIDSSDTLVKKKSITMDSSWHTYKAVVDDGEVDVYMDNVLQFRSTMQTLSGIDLVQHWLQSASQDTAEAHVDYTHIY